MKSEKAAQLEFEQVALELSIKDLNRGLCWEDANSRFRQFGPNDFSVSEQESLIWKYVNQFKDPLILLLLASASASILMGQYDDALSITIAICIVVSVAFIQEYRSERSLEELKKLVSHNCAVLRDYRVEQLPTRDIVPGDIVVLQTGDRVPADVRVFRSNQLLIDESSLTGEAKPARKDSAVILNLDDSGMGLKTNIAFMGTLVRSGNGRGIVIGTGERSEFGDIFKLMKSEDSPKTPLQKSMDSLGKQLSLYSFLVIGFILCVGWYQGRSLHLMVNIGVSLAVAAIPEGLPIVVTVTLALGVMRMADKKAVVKKLPTVETLGCVNVICSDKTGTLTQNRMTVTDVITADSIRLHIVDEEDTNYRGTDLKSVRRVLACGAICNNADLVSHVELRGQPTETALLVAAEKFGVYDVRNDFTREEEIPFTSDSKYMLVKTRPNSREVPDSRLYFMKGSLETVLQRCCFVFEGDSVIPLTDTSRLYFIEEAKTLASRGLRILAFANGSTLHSLCFLGIVGMLDPPRSGVRDSILIMKACSIDVKMITGDGQETARAIAQRIGIPSETTVSGLQLERMNDFELLRRVRETSIFYRTRPAHKLRIVKALQSQGLVCAMTGDGVNDAVALRKSDIGISMGASGTDVSKEASDMILLDDDFSTLISAIEEGKSIFHNIRNFIRFQLSTSISALFLITISTISGIPNPLNAMQILWINILMDGPPAQSLGVEPVDHDILRQPPRNTTKPILDFALLTDVLISASVIILGTLYVFRREMSDQVITRRDTTMTFTCFVFFDMFNALSCRSQTKSIFQIGFLSNKVFFAAILVSFGGQLMVIYLPFFQYVFQTESLSLSDISELVLLASSVFIVSELKKFFDRMKRSEFSTVVNRKRFESV